MIHRFIIGAFSHLIFMYWIGWIIILLIAWKTKKQWLNQEFIRNINNRQINNVRPTNF